MPDDVAEIIASCEGRLLKAGTIKEPFTATEIQGGYFKRIPHRGRLYGIASGK